MREQRKNGAHLARGESSSFSFQLLLEYVADFHDAASSCGKCDTNDDCCNCVDGNGDDGDSCGICDYTQMSYNTIRL